MKIDSAVELKKVHAREIIDILKKNKITTKKKITEDTGLSFATVSNICNEMREKGYIEELAADEEKVVGRTPKNIALKSENLLALCYDLTKNGVIQAAVIDYLSNILYEKDFTYPKDCHITQLVDICTDIYENSIRDRFKDDRIIGVGVAVPGIFEKKTRNIVSSEIEMFNNQPLKEMLAAALKKNVYIDNDSNLCVMSKYVMANEEALQEDVVYVFADEGLGIGVVANGKLLRGSGGYAPEICHMPIGNPLLTCHLCSSKGCVESDLRIMGYVEKYNLYSEIKIDDYAEFQKQLEKEDVTALRVIDENTQIWGNLLSILNNIFNPSHIYIGGETITVIQRGMKKILHQIESRLLVADNAMSLIELDENCSETVLKGAAQMLFSQWMPQV